MDRNNRLYQASYHLVDAAKLLTDIDNDLKQLLLDKAMELSNKIVINKQEVEKVNEYKTLILKEEEE